MDMKETVSVLNDLIETSKDGEKGGEDWRHASELGLFSFHLARLCGWPANIDPMETDPFPVDLKFRELISAYIYWSIFKISRF